MTTDLIQRLKDERDLCAAEHAAEISNLLGEAAAELERLYSNVDAAIAFCPTCCQGVTASPNMTHDELIFECGKVAGKADAKKAAS